MDPQDSQPKQSALLKFLAAVKPHTRLVAGAALMGVGKFTLPLAFPLAMKYIIDDLLASGTPKLAGASLAIDNLCAWMCRALGLSIVAQNKLAILSVILLALYALQAVASYYRNYWAGIAGNRLVFDLQCRLFAHLQRLGHSFFDRNPAGVIASRVLSDVIRAHELVESALVDVWMDAASLGLVVLVLFALNSKLAMVALAVAPFWVASMHYFAPRIRKVSHSVQEAFAEISGDVHERVTGAATVKSFGREEHEVMQFQERGSELYLRTIDKVRLAAVQEMLIQLLTRSAPVVVVWTGAVMIMHGTLTLGTLVAFSSYVAFLYLPLERFAQLSVVLSASMAAIERIFDFLALKPDIADHPLSRPFPIRGGSVRFEDVSFSYMPESGDARRQVLANVDLTVPGGCRIALVGKSGAGKTTLANLVPRFYDVTGGRVVVDGRDVRHYSLRTLRDSISLVSQDALLFSASIRSNLLYARPEACEGGLWQALESANLRDFVESLPDGLDTVIGERGVKLSGGQRQRVAVARAFLKDAKILIMDEATSAVDSESENLIHEAMERLMAGRTVFLIAHRLRSAITADMVAVLDRGRIIEVGSHSELLRRRGAYTRLFNEQVRGLSIGSIHQQRESSFGVAGF